MHVDTFVVLECFVFLLFLVKDIEHYTGIICLGTVPLNKFYTTHNFILIILLLQHF